MKKKMISISTIAAVTMMAGSAFAALPNLDAGNTTMATELVQPVTDTAAPAVFLAYQTNGAVAPGTQMKFSLINGSFAPVLAADGATGWNLCSSDGAGNVSKLATRTATAAADTSVTLTLAEGLGVGIVYYLSSDDCSTADALNHTIAIGNVPKSTGDILVAGGTTSGTVSMAVTSVTNPGDAKVETSGVIVTLMDQLSATITPVVSKMAFATGRTTLIDDTATNANYPNTTIAGNTSDSAAKIVIKNLATIGNKVTYVGGTGVAPDADCAGLLSNAGDVIKAKVTGNLTGIDKIVYTAPTPVTTATYTLLAADYTNGYATLSIPGNKIGICSTTSPNVGKAPGLILDIDTAIGTVLAPTLIGGSFTTELKLVGAGAGAASRASATRVLTTATSHTLAFDGTQYYLELARTDATRETYVKIQSKNVTAGANGLSVAVLCGNGTMKSFVPAATLVAGTPATITGAEMAAACAATSAVNANGFAAIITVNAPEADVFGYANIQDATGAKRVTLKTVNGVIVE